VRGTHPSAEQPWLWINTRGGRLTDSGIYQLLKRRCRAAGVPEIHPHQLRHLWAVNLKRNGVSDSIMKTLGGWRDDAMIHRYGKAEESAVAAEVHRAIAPGDDL
jgi:site-specific recombinase XerD